MSMLISNSKVCNGELGFHFFFFNLIFFSDENIRGSLAFNTITENDVSSPDIQIVGRRKLALEIYHFNGWWLHFDRCISLFVGNYPAIMPSYGNCRRLLTHC